MNDDVNDDANNYVGASNDLGNDASDYVGVSDDAIDFVGACWCK